MSFPADSVDCLRGLKENIIVGHPVPTGAGKKRYREMKLFDEEQRGYVVLIRYFYSGLIPL
jgi:DNA-directed RNA polymerase subunit beta'